MRSVTRFATLLFATAALAACDDKADFSNVVLPNVTSIGGTWILQTLNGHGLPAAIVAANTDSVTASTLTLVANNSTSGTFTLTVSRQNTTPPDLTGTYTLNGAALTLTSNDSPPVVLTGSFSGGNTLTLTQLLNGAAVTTVTAVYARQ